MSVTEATTGISFALSDEQRALRELAHEFAEREIRRVAADYDERSQHPAEVIAKAHEVGLMNPHIPDDLGGPGLSAFEQILIGEELAWGCSGNARPIRPRSRSATCVSRPPTGSEPRARASRSRCGRST